MNTSRDRRNNDDEGCLTRSLITAFYIWTQSSQRILCMAKVLVPMYILPSYCQFSIPALLPRTDHSENRHTTSYYYIRSDSKKMDFSKHTANLMQFTLKRLILIFKIAVLWLSNYALQVLTVSSLTHWLNLSLKLQNAYSNISCPLFVISSVTDHFSSSMVLGLLA